MSATTYHAEDPPRVDYGFRKHCRGCDHDSAETYRCERCGKDLAESDRTTSGRTGGNR